VVSFVLSPNRFLDRGTSALTLDAETTPHKHLLKVDGSGLHPVWLTPA